MSDDSQDQAEALDADKIDDDADPSGDDVGEGLPDFPPDRPLGVNTVGVTPVEEDAGESFAERTWREVPDPAAQPDPAGDALDANHDDELEEALDDVELAVEQHDDELEEVLADVELEVDENLAADELAVEDDVAGQLVEPDASTLDHEAQEFAEEEEPSAELAPEEQAMHIEDDDR